MRKALALSLAVHAAVGGALWWRGIDPPGEPGALPPIAMRPVEAIPLDQPPPPPDLPPAPAVPAEDLTVPEPAAEPPMDWSASEPEPAYAPRRPLRFAPLARPLPRRAPPPAPAAPAVAPAPTPVPQVRVAPRAAPAPAARVRPPRLDRARSPRPGYPLRARRLGLEGEVIIRARVSATGAVAAAEVERSSGHETLDRAALAAVKRYRYEPARRAGRPVPYDVRVPVLYRLSE